MAWWLHQMETFPASLALCAGNSAAIGEFPSQTPVTRSFDVLYALCLNKQLGKQSRRRWLETPSRSLWHQYHGVIFWHTNLVNVFFSRIYYVVLFRHLYRSTVNRVYLCINIDIPWTADKLLALWRIYIYIYIYIYISKNVFTGVTNCFSAHERVAKQRGK